MGLELVAPIVLVVCGSLSVIAATYEVYLLVLYLLSRHRKAVGGELPRIAEAIEKPNDGMPSLTGTAEWTPDPNIDYPTVTIQLPAYNELTCLDGLLHAMARIHWPRERLQIQLLDDSTHPKAVGLAKEIIASLSEEGVIIEHRTRENRIGYKAGNLLHHFDSIRGDYVAIFDADFLPAPDFLLQMIPHFFDDKGVRIPDIGLVQATWDHYNQTDNLLTHVQGLLQNMHFIFQQNACCRTFHFMPFNGTAGVWTKESIRSSGNWNYDTVTEDLDIACRAKVNGYRFVYLEHVTVPSEVPPTMMAYKRQQRRWTQGHIQVGRKIIRAVWKSELFSVAQKIDITHMIFNRLNWLPSCIATFFVPLLGFTTSTPLLMWLILAAALYVVGAWSVIFIIVLNDTKFMHPHMLFWQRMRRIYVVIPFFFLRQTGMTFWQAVSVIEGFILNDIPFATTPKSGKVEDQLDEENLQTMEEMAEIDDLDQVEEEGERTTKTLHYAGWDSAATNGEPTKIKRRKPKMLSKSFPKWSHFVELLLACYWLIVPVFYENILFGIPIMISSLGFWWVALPGIRTSLVRWSKAVSKRSLASKPYSKEQDEIGVTEVSSAD